MGEAEGSRDAEAAGEAEALTLGEALGECRSEAVALTLGEALGECCGEAEGVSGAKVACGESVNRERLGDRELDAV